MINFQNEIPVIRNKVLKVEQLEDFNEEYVYDIGIDDKTPYFFGNNILVHNSSYFTINPLIKKNESLKSLLTTRESIIEFYDEIAEQTNNSFAEFMHQTFNTGMERGKIIKAGRELIGSRGLFITKKKYAILVYDKEGTRLDINGKPGKMKVMGLDLKRSDTPKIMQVFLEKILTDLLVGISKDDIFEQIKIFREEFKNLDPWLKGSPKKVNAFGDYQKKLIVISNKNNFTNLKSKGEKTGKMMVPGHVQASLNWMELKNKYSDKYSMDIQDGQKIIVCKLKSNPLKMDSIAYPIDESHIPEWFKNLPFDNDAMENTIIDMKLDNLLGCLGWNFIDTKNDTTFNDLFTF